MFVSDWYGRVKVFDSVDDTSPTLAVDIVTEVHSFGDRGLLGMKLDPQFGTAGHNYIYLGYAYDTPMGSAITPKTEFADGSDNCKNEPPYTDCLVSGRVVRIALNPATGVAAAGAAEPPQQQLVQSWCQQFNSHSMGDLEFDSEGALLVSGGEGANYNVADYGQFENPCGDPENAGGSLRAQDVRSSGDQTDYSGSIIRIDPATGEPLADNPLFADADVRARRILAFGLRNPFRFELRPGTDEIYVGDVGQANWEELNRFASPPASGASAFNFGWPCYEGADGANAVMTAWQSRANEGHAPLCKTLYETPNLVTAPLFAYGHGSPAGYLFEGDACNPAPGAAFSGLAFYNPAGVSADDAFPAQYQGALFMADAARGCIWTMGLDGSGQPDPTDVANFATGDGAGKISPVDIVQGPDGALYAPNFYNDSIEQIRYIGSNSPPTAQLQADKVDGPMVGGEFEVEFDASGSSDAEGDAIEYSWDLDGDGQFDDGSDQPTAEWTYTSETNVVAKVRAEDEFGRADEASVNLYPGDLGPPVPTIEAPSADLEWAIGDTLDYAGSAVDPDGDPVTDFKWRISIQHCPDDCHEHPYIEPETASGSFAAPPHEYPSHLSFVLTATDSRGRSAASAPLESFPEVVEVGLASDPPGVPLTFDGEPGSAGPFKLIAGGTAAVSAPATAIVDGISYVFSGWSDGGARVHDFTGLESETLTATYEAAGATPPAAVYWGGTIKGEVYGMAGEAPKTPAVWERFEHDAGKEVTFVNTGQTWGQFDTATMQKAIDGGAIPLVTMDTPASVTMQDVAEGKQDTQIRAWAKAAKAFGYPFMLRPWREVNGGWYAWGRDPNFIDAWRHFHDLVEEEGATNVTWAWIVNTIWSDPASDPTPYYPGDAYVDWVGMDAYNWGRNIVQPDIWLSPEQAIGPTLDVLEAVAPDKPVALTEVASSEYAGNKASWIRDLLDSYLPNHPNIKALIWFNWNIQQGGLRYDWQIESSTTAEQAFRDGIQSSEYLSVRPPLTPLAKVPMPYWPGPAKPLVGGSGPVALGDGIWSPATELGAGGGDERGARLAIGPDGTITAVWGHYDGSNWVIQARRIGAGGTSLGPVHQLSAAGADAFDARVAVGPDGTATVVWKRFNGSDFVIQERRIGPSGTPEAAAHDLSLPGQFTGQPQVAARPDGGAVVVWQRHNASRDVTRIQSAVIRPNGTATACCFDLTDAAFNRNGFEPQVAVAPDSTAIVVWNRHNGSEQIVQARKLATTGVPAATTYDVSTSGRNAIESEVAIMPSGKAIVSWTRFDGTKWVVQARQLNAAGEPAPSGYDVSEGSGHAIQPHLAALPDGSAAIVWKQLVDGRFVVKERRLGADGVPAAGVYDLSAAGADAHEPRIAVGVDGSASVVWSLDDEAGKVVQVRRIAADGTPAADTVNLSEPGANAGAPFVASGGDSSVAVAWRRFDQVQDHVQFAAFGLPAVSIDPSSHDFGSVVVGAGPSQPRTFTIGNPGSTSLKVSSIALEGGGAGQFRLQDPSSCASATLAPRSTCQVSVTFEPSALGGFEAQLRVNSNAFFGSDTGAVQGVGVAAPPAGTATAPIAGAGTTAPKIESPSNSFRFGRIKLNRKLGTARLAVWLPGPGSLRFGGKGIAALSRSGKRTAPVRNVTGQGTVLLDIGAVGAKRVALLKRGRVKVLVKVSYVPSGGSGLTKARSLVLHFQAQSPRRRGR